MTTEVQMTREQFSTFWEKFKKGIANDLVNELVRVCPVDNGFLRNSIHYKVEGDTIWIKMADYALYVEFGTPPHIIKPKTAKALHWKAGGKDVFASIVHHPGTRPQPFIRNTLRSHFGDIIRNNLVRLTA